MMSHETIKIFTRKLSAQDIMLEGANTSIAFLYENINWDVHMKPSEL